MSTQTTDTVLAAYHLQCARWDLSILINEHHDRHECHSAGSSCEELHDIRATCRTPSRRSASSSARRRSVTCESTGLRIM